MHVPHTLPTLRVSNGEDAYAFVGMVSFDAKSIGACHRHSMRSIAAGVDVVEVDMGAKRLLLLSGLRKVGQDGGDGGCSGSGERVGRMW